jgi:hypothetical protein
MIGESSGVTTLINNERIQKENQVRPESKVPDPTEEAKEGKISDVTSFSSESIALAKNIVPVGGSVAQNQVEQQNQRQPKGQDSSARFLDIRA